MSETLSRPAQILRDLIRCPSVTPVEGGAFAVLESYLKPLGFTLERVTFSDKNTPDVENLYARIGTGAPHLMFAGHTDVVPVGIEADWKFAPFEAQTRDGIMYGRGAVDMKGGIACFIAAVELLLVNNKSPNGSISLLITGDEEGPAINGTDKLLQWAKDKGEVWDAAIVGEPTSRDAIGDMIKNGRRGSLSGMLTVNGVQGHVAYPQLADNPVRGLVDLLNCLLETPFDTGTDVFQPTNLEVTSIDVGNPAVNVIPAKVTAAFNVRFNDTWDGESLRVEILRRFNEGAKSGRIRQDRQTQVNFEVTWVERTNHVFLTRDNRLTTILSGAIKQVTGYEPELSTGGGTSDARFIKDYCPVLEFGLVGRSVHKVDECTSLADLDTLTAVYLKFLENYFAEEG